MSFQCSECGTIYGTKRTLQKHWQEEHPSQLETPEEHLPDDDSEQRDFEGEGPETDAHNPEPLATNDPPETERSSLFEFGGDGDAE